MKKEFVPYEQALELKQLGFNKECFAGYDIDTKELYIGYENDQRTFNIEHFILSPLYQQAFRFFKEKYNLEGFVNLNDSKENDFNYYYNYIDTNNNINNRRENCNFFIGNFKTYEEAELECLKKLIEIVKSK